MTHFDDRLKDLRRRDLFAETAHRTAAWRITKYEELTANGTESWRDRDNLGAAYGIRGFAKWVKSLPDDDPDLAFLVVG